MNTCEKYYWIKDHPAFINPDYLPLVLEIDPHMVCPVTNRIEQFERLNTQHQLWVEVMVPQYDEDEKKWAYTHNWNLDTGGNTWEIMIEKLYDLVVEEYGTYTDEDYHKKFEEVHQITRISRSTVNAKPRKLKVRWNLNPPSWGDDILSKDNIALLREEILETEGTIKALTEYRKTCNISEYEEVDAALEKENFILFEQTISLQTGIDLVRK